MAAFFFNYFLEFGKNVTIYQVFKGFSCYFCKTMWDRFATLILKKRVYFIAAILLFTGVMGYYATKVELEYNFQKLVPSDDPDHIAYKKFNATFGEDGNKLVVGFASDQLFQLKTFQAYYKLSEELSKQKGVKDVISPTKLFSLSLDTADKFVLHKFIPTMPQTQAEVDSIKQMFLEMPFYRGLLYNEETNACLLVISIEDKFLNSKERKDHVLLWEKIIRKFAADNNLEIHLSGLPYVRTMYATEVRAEIIMLTAISFVVTALLILLFFRSISTLLISLLFIVIGVVSMLGLCGLLGYKISLLTGTLPPLLVVIGVQNTIYLINKYHEEYSKCRNQARALTRVVSRIGLANFLINFTTAVGFGTFYFTKIHILEEYGMVSFLVINIVFLITLIGLPALYSFLPVPSDKQIQHLENKNIIKFLDWVKFMVFNHKRRIYFWFTLFTLLSTIFVFRLRPLAFMVDDIPHDSHLYKDLEFFQDNFKGVMPYEILIKTNDEHDAANPTTLAKVNSLQKALKRFPELSKPISLVEIVSYANQVVNNNDPAYYRMPKVTDLGDISMRMPEGKGNNQLMKGLMDSSHSQLRVSYQIRDVGSVRLDSINNAIYEILERIFPKEEYQVQVTGTSAVFLKGNSYLYGSLNQATFWSIFIISLTMGLLFPSIRMIIIAIIPNAIPLLVTAGTMGYFGVPLKPSTILVFSIAFGITVDATIHFVITFRRELVKHNHTVRVALSNTISEVGHSMIYTMVAICAGFMIFVVSSFQGTVWLGWLTGLTLMVGMAANLFLLPALILTLEHRLNPKEELEDTVLDIEEEEDGESSTSDVIRG